MPYSTLLVPLLRDARSAGWVTYYMQYMREYNAESQKQDSKRFKFQVRGNTLRIWVYYLSMRATHTWIKSLNHEFITGHDYINFSNCKHFIQQYETGIL